MSRDAQYSRRVASAPNTDLCGRVRRKWQRDSRWFALLAPSDARPGPSGWTGRDFDGWRHGWPTNCIREPFSQSEIGHSKAVILASRLNLFWNLNWHGIPHHLCARTSLDRVDIVIGCVDSRGARKLIAEKTSGQRSAVYYWLDLGNHASGGQFVLGQPWNWVNRRSAARLRTVAELFPELIDASLEDDRQPSCSAIEALERQEPFVNPTLANHALALLARLFRYGSLEHHGAFVNVAASRVQPLGADRKIWRALRRRGAGRPRRSSSG